MTSTFSYTGKMDVFPIKSEKVKYHKTQKLFWNRRKIFAFFKSKSEKKRKKKVKSHQMSVPIEITRKTFTDITRDFSTVLTAYSIPMNFLDLFTFAS